MSLIGNSRINRMIGILIVTLMLAGCGQKGPLTLPQQSSLGTSVSTLSG
jgi:predicted small lipoprotein YifL